MPILTLVPHDDAPDHDAFDDASDDTLMIACDGCPARRLGVCDDCIVTVLLASDERTPDELDDLG
jgi:hypothetical protein